MARAAEAVGFDSVWVGDHYLYRGDGRPERGPWEAWTTARGARRRDRARDARAARGVRWFHAPAVLAKHRGDRRRDLRRSSRARHRRRVEPDRVRRVRHPYDHRASRFEEASRSSGGSRGGASDVRGHVRDGAGRGAAAAAGAPRAADGGQHRGAGAADALPHADAWNTWFDWYGNTRRGVRGSEREGDRGGAPSGGATPSRSSGARACWSRSTAGAGNARRTRVTALAGSPGRSPRTTRARRGGRRRGDRGRRPDHRGLDPAVR